MTRPAAPPLTDAERATQAKFDAADYPAEVRDAAVLARHYWSEHGLSYGAPDRCSCGAKTYPVAGDDDVMERRARAFAGHQAEVLAAARSASSALAPLGAAGGDRG